MPAYMAKQKHDDIRDAIASGMRIEDIRELLSTSAGSVLKIKREMGIPIRPMGQTRTRGPIKTAAQPSEGDPPSNHTYAEAHIESLYAEQPAPTAPPVSTAPPVPRPEAYVTAFENRVMEYRELLRQYNQTILERDGTIERLKKELATLRDEYAQTVFRQQNWTGPTSVMNQSLGNGG